MFYLYLTKYWAITSFFSDLRLTAYETLSLWMITAKSASCVYMYADSLIPVILTDVSPVANQLNLTVILSIFI